MAQLLQSRAGAWDRKRIQRVVDFLQLGCLLPQGAILTTWTHFLCLAQEVLCAPLLALEVVNDRMDLDGFRLLEMRPTVCQKVLDIEELIQRRRTDHLSLVRLVQEELLAKTKISDADPFPFESQFESTPDELLQALDQHKKYINGLKMRALNSNAEFVRSTNVVFDIMNGWSPKRRQSFLNDVFAGLVCCGIWSLVYLLAAAYGFGSAATFASFSDRATCASYCTASDYSGTHGNDTHHTCGTSVTGVLQQLRTSTTSATRLFLFAPGFNRVPNATISVDVADWKTNTRFVSAWSLLTGICGAGYFVATLPGKELGRRLLRSTRVGNQEQLDAYMSALRKTRGRMSCLQSMTHAMQGIVLGINCRAAIIPRIVAEIIGGKFRTITVLLLALCTVLAYSLPSTLPL